MTEKELEVKKLNDTLNIISKVLEKEKIDLNKLYSDFVGDREQLWRYAESCKIHIKNLETSLDKPYFARIDFTADDNKELQSLYIGKNGVIEDTNIVVTDWRAPICSLYYDAEIGECSFEAPEGTITGNMSLKRQYEIELGKLIDYFDVSLVSNDGLLQKYLNSNNDARLKSIVATIQKEQNDVIRKQLFKNLIIQGVAGSGKTTVALHRIAYLVYNYLKSVKQNQYMVIGPNPVFIKYIKSVLPDLDVSGVEQCTFEQFAKMYINEDIKIRTSEKKVNDNIAGRTLNDIDKFKCSIKYKTMIDQFLNIFYQSLTANDLKLGEFIVLRKEVIKEKFDYACETSRGSLNDIVEKTTDILVRYIENNNDKLTTRYGNYVYETFKESSSEIENDKLRKQFAKDREELRKNCRSTLRKYFTKAKVSPSKLYKVFVNSINDLDIYNYSYIKELKKESLKSVKDNEYDFEDLAALIYIKKVISPNKDFDNIKHVVIDEAQDLGEFNFIVLKNTLPNATFSIFGDLAQSIYDYRGINNWEEVNKCMFNDEGEIINFNKSYRTTAEIMNVADEVAASIGLCRSDLVVRHGEPVKFTNVEDDKDIPNYIYNKIMEYKARGYKTIAVISKTNLLSRYINDDLNELGLSIPNVTMNDDLSDEKFRICTISNQLSKGLEFDAVIINNASEHIYNSEKSLDMKLLYVAITRALHDIDIIYSNELTKPLSSVVKKNNSEVIKLKKITNK